MKLSEKQFMAQVVQLARLSGWAVYHTFDSRKSAAGFPDLVLARCHELIFAELKTDRGETTAAQIAWLTILSATGARTFIWRPRDWEEIQAILTAPRRRGA